MIRRQGDVDSVRMGVYEWERVRKVYYIEGKSIRQIARETRRARRTIQRFEGLRLEG